MHCCSNASCGLPFFGGMSFVSESGACGLKVLPFGPVTVVPGVVEKVDVVADGVPVPIGEVTAGIDTP